MKRWWEAKYRNQLNPISQRRWSGENKIDKLWNICLIYILSWIYFKYYIFIYLVHIWCIWYIFDMFHCKVCKKKSIDTFSYYTIQNIHKCGYTGGCNCDKWVLLMRQLFLFSHDFTVGNTCITKRMFFTHFTHVKKRLLPLPPPFHTENFLYMRTS